MGFMGKAAPIPLQIPEVLPKFPQAFNKGTCPVQGLA